MSDYSFIKEVVKEKPINKKAFFTKVVFIILGAVLFGVIAAVTFVNVLPQAAKSFINENESPQLNIEDEQPPEGGSGVSAGTEGEEEEEDPQVIEVPAELGLSDYKQFYQDMVEASQNASKSVVTVAGITDNMDWFNNSYENQSQISGMIIANTSQELFILTEYRGVENADRIQVTFWNGTSVEAVYQKHDPNTGLCILRTAAADIDSSTFSTLVTAPLGSSYSVRQGDPIMALGSPMGYSDSIAFGMLTSVSNKVSEWDRDYTVLTTDIVGTQEGSGVLLNLDGEIIGVIMQGYASGSNMITCLGVSEITDLIESLSNNSERPYIGIRGQDVTAETAERTGLPAGVYVSEVQVDSPAMVAGLMNGDVIVGMDGETIETLSEYTRMLGKLDPNTAVRLTVMRQGAEGYTEIVFDVTVGAL
ncbi:MAG: S1C family serine protease [Ruminococcus sp.]|jgi:serine protease Do